MMFVRFIFALALPVLLSVAAQAQAPENLNPESIQIGLSTDHVYISSDFSGADLTIFGALDFADPLLSRQGRYDVIVVLEGPARPVVVRRKSRVLGMWINTWSETFINVPVSYSVATTRVWQDITIPDSYRQMALGAENIALIPQDRDGDTLTLAEFSSALRERKKAEGLYSERIGGVQFLSQSLFRATVHLAPDVPVGTHRARAFLFKNGIFIKESSAQLAILKAGFEQTVYNTAQRHGLLYGLAAVFLALLTGWVGRLIFSRD